MKIEDARALVPPPSLHREGFMLARLATGVRDLYDADAVRAGYYPEVERLVRDVTGADRVLAFDHNVRSALKAKEGTPGVQKPILYAHNDYTDASGPRRLHELLEPAEAQERLARRFAVVNVWKPIRGPVRRAPLAVCDARSIAPGDFVPTDLRYRDRTGEVYSMRWRPVHRWFYFPNMAADEALLLKCYDSDASGARYTAHTAFDDPTSSDDAPHRESIEVRTMAFF